MQVKMDCEWAFEAKLESEKEKWIEVLRPGAIDMIGQMTGIALEHRVKTNSPSTTISEHFEFECDGCSDIIYTFVAVIVNRDLPPGAVVFVASTKKVIEIMADSWNKACQERLTQ